tara:strand:- start:7841 stop:8140 length:300 start_codon:yes stop_codon:yes gene_type:complete
MSRTLKTRFGRKIKAPERWEPIETVTDDYKSDEYDTDDDEDEVMSIHSDDSGEGDDGNESDESFIVSDDNVDYDDADYCCDSEEEEDDDEDDEDYDCEN